MSIPELQKLKQDKIQKIAQLQKESKEAFSKQFGDLSQASQAAVENFYDKFFDEYKQATQSYYLLGLRFPLKRNLDCKSNELLACYGYSDVDCAVIWRDEIMGFDIKMRKSPGKEGEQEAFFLTGGEGLHAARDEKTPRGKDSILKDLQNRPIAQTDNLDYTTVYMAKYEFALNSRFEGSYVF